MVLRRAVTWMLVLALVFVSASLLDPGAVSAAPAEQGCQTKTWDYDPGKTVEGFKARATDGCNVYEWTGSIAQGPASGIVTFTTTNKTNPWDGDLPNESGVAGYNKMRAAHEANMMWIHGFKTGPGVRVTVTYSAD